MVIVPINRSGIRVPQARSLPQSSTIWRFLGTGAVRYKLYQSSLLNARWTYTKNHPNSTPLNCRYLLSIQRENARLRML